VQIEANGFPSGRDEQFSPDLPEEKGISEGLILLEILCNIDSGSLLSMRPLCAQKLQSAVSAPDAPPPKDQPGTAPVVCRHRTSSPSVVPKHKA
jgi:hypothetical protein